MSRKTPNPNKIPKTQADVDRSYALGVQDGTNNATVIIMSVLLDKFGAADYLPDIWKAIGKLSEEVAEGRVSIPDLRTTLREEYDYDP